MLLYNNAHPTVRDTCALHWLIQFINAVYTPITLFRRVALASLMLPSRGLRMSSHVLAVAPLREDDIELK